MSRMQTHSLRKRWRILCFGIRHFQMWRRSGIRKKEIPIGELIVPPPFDLDLLPFARLFYPKGFLLGPHPQEDPVGEIFARPQVDVDASLVEGANTSAVPLGSAPPPVDRIQLAQASMKLVQG